MIATMPTLVFASRCPALCAALGLLYALATPAALAQPVAKPSADFSMSATPTNFDGLAFTAIALHDVADVPAQMRDDSISTDRLVGFFEWLKGNRFNAISLTDVDAARRGVRALPQRAVLVTFDDGYASLYHRVFPLALAYRVPIVAALAGSWMEGPMDGMVQYGDLRVPRSGFITWPQAREMQASGLIEFASHGYDIHHGERGNPQGSVMPAAVTRVYTEGAGYETQAAYQARIRADLMQSREQLLRELGTAPRAMVWPFGRYSKAAADMAQALGFSFALTLDEGPASAARPMAISRHFPSGAPTLDTLASMADNNTTLAAVQRWVCVDPAKFWTGNAAADDQRLGLAIERLRTLGATGVVIDAAQTGPDGRLTGAWFPNSVLPVQGDVLARLTWQLQTRAGVATYVYLPAGQALTTLGDAQRVERLFEDLGAHVPMGGLLVDDALQGVVVPGPAHTGRTWETRAARDALDLATLPAADALAMRSFRAVQRSRPWVELAIRHSGPAAAPSPLADISWRQVPLQGGPDAVPVKTTARPMSAHGQAYAAMSPLQSNTLRRSGVWLSAGAAPDADRLAQSVTAYQRSGQSTLGWCQDDPLANQPEAARAAPAVSGATFPVKF